MQGENPTGDAGASISSRLESYLAASEGDSNPQPKAQAPQPKEPQSTPEKEEETPEVEGEHEPADDEQAGSDEPQVTLSDVAKYLGIDESLIDVSDDGGISIKTKIDGKEGTAKLNDLVKSYQLQGHVDAKSREASELQKTLSERVQQFEQFAQSEAQRLSQVAQIAQAELMGDFNAINWQELARNDPAEYVAKQAEFQQRQGRVNQLLGEVQHRAQQAQQAQQQRIQQSVQMAAQYIAANVEGWKPGNEVDKSLLEYATKAGISNTRDLLVAAPSIAVALHKAMLFDQGKAKQAVTEKMVRQAPKLVKPGQSVDAKQRAADGLRDLKQTIRKSGGKDGIQEYLLRTGKV